MLFIPVCPGTGLIRFYNVGIICLPFCDKAVLQPSRNTGMYVVHWKLLIADRF